MAEPAFDPELLDALARCFAEAAVRRWLAEQSTEQSATEPNSLTPLEKSAKRTHQGRDVLSVPAPSAAGSVGHKATATLESDSNRTIPEVCE